MKTDQEASRAAFPEDSGNKDRKGRLYSEKILPSSKIVEKVKSKREHDGCIAYKSYVRSPCHRTGWALIPTCRKVSSSGCPCVTIKEYKPHCRDYGITCSCAARY